MKYSNEQIERMVNEYNKGMSYSDRTKIIENLAIELNSTEGSIRSKLVAEGVYIKAVAVIKTKDVIVKAFEAVSGKSLQSMNNMTKRELQDLWDWVLGMNNDN